MSYNGKKCEKNMKVGDIVYAQHPRMIGTDAPGIIIEKRPMYKAGYQYRVMFPGIGLKWIKWTFNLIKLEDAWSKECE